MTGRRPFLVFLSLILAAGGVIFSLDFLDASAQSLAGPPDPGPSNVDSKLLDRLENESAADIVVVLAETPDLHQAYEIQDWDSRGWFVYNALMESAVRSQAPVVEYARDHRLQYRSFFSNNIVFLENADLDAVQDLAALPGVIYIREPRLAQIQPGVEVGISGPAAYNWNLDLLDPNSGLFGMQAAQVWQQYGVTGENVVVANIDTGAYYQHVALDRQYRGNLTGSIGGPYDHDFSWYQPNFQPCGNGTYPCDADYYGHGTGTIGIMVGESPDLSKQIGVAPGAQWISCMGCDDPPYCSEVAILGCADWMLAPCAIGDDPGDPSCSPEKRPQIVNNSWGGSGCDTWFQPSVQAWTASGIFPAFAAGNAGGCGTLASPGDLPGAFGIAAHFTDGANAYAGGPSCFAPAPTCDPSAHDIDPHLNAPTGGETATNAQATYLPLGGTSGASPHVAGTVALLWAANPGLMGQIDATYTILEQSANRDLPAASCGKPACAGANGYPNYDLGWGYLDSLAAVEMAGVGALGTLTGTVVEAGGDAPGDPLPDVTIMAQQPGSVYALSGDTDSAGIYTLTLPAGTYTVTADGAMHGPEAVSGIEVLSQTAAILDFELLPKGLLSGFITDEETGAPLAATVGTADANPVQTDPATGYYSIYLGAGSQDVWVNAGNYVSQTVTLNIVSGQQVQQDFSLLVALVMTPNPVEVTVELNGSLDLTTAVTNRSPVVYTYQLVHEAARAGDEGTVLLVHDETLDENPDAFATALTNLDYDYNLIDVADFTAKPVSELLGYAVVIYTGVPDSGAEQDQITAYLDAGGRFLLADGSFTLYYGDSLLHEVYLQALQDELYEWSGPQIGLDIMSGVDPDISSSVVVYDSYAGPEGVGIFQAPGSNYSGIRTERAGYRALYLSFDLNRIGAREPGDAVETEVVYRAMLWLLGYNVDDPWISTDVVTGSIPAATSGSIAIQFAPVSGNGIHQPGEFYAELHIEPDAVGESFPRLDVPVHLTVVPAATMGQVSGLVMSDRPGGPLAADVWIENAGGGSWTTSSDWWTGNYRYWLEAGTYTLTLSEVGYYSQTAQLLVSSGLTTTLDFNMVLAAPEISVTPLEIDETLAFGSAITRTVGITNSGPEPLSFDIQERDRGQGSLPGLALLGSSSERLDGMRILMDEYHGSNINFYGEMIADLESLGATVDLWSSGPITSTVLEGYDVLFIGDLVDLAYGYDELDAIDSFVRQGGGLFVSYECCDDATAPEVTALFDIVYYGPGGTSGVTSLVYPHPTTQDVGAVYLPSPQVLFTATITGTAETVLFDSGGEPAAIVNEVENGKVFVMPDQEFWDGVYTQEDNMQFGRNVFRWLAGDVAWLSTDISSGLVAPGESLTVTVFLDGSAVSEPGVYFGDLVLPNNDPFAPSAGIPITLTVEPTADLGRLQGTISSDRPGGALPAKILLVDSEGLTQTVYSLPSTGAYHRWLASGSYTATATSSGYLSQTAVVDIPGAGSFQQDFTLILDAPGAAATPLAVETGVTWNMTATRQITVSNIGQQVLDFFIQEEDLAGEAVMQAPQAFTFDFENDTFASFSLDAPGSWNVIATWSYQYFDGGDFRLNDFSKLYVIHGDYLYTLDTATGDDDYVASIGIPYPHMLTGMTIAADGTIYAVTDYWYGFPSEPHESYLWTIDPVHGTPTQIGQITNAEYIGDIAINLSGEMVGVDLEQDVLIQIDPGTAAGTVIGPVGFDLWYATLEFDDDSGVLYMGTWDYLSGQGALWMADMNTGAPTWVGDFPAGRGISFLAIVSDGLLDIPWLAETPVSGSILPGGVQAIDLVFDAGNVSGPGDYLGSLHFMTNDPLLPDLEVPVTMTVVSDETAGQINGVVSGLGPCDDEIYPASAQIWIESSTGITWTVSTDPLDGSYSQWVPEGSYTVTASAVDHVPAAAGVQVQAGQTTTTDFNLRLFQPCAVITPTVYSMTLSVGNLLTQSLIIANEGAKDLVWELRETTDTMAIPPIPAFEGEIPYSAGPPSIMPLPVSPLSRVVEPLPDMGSLLYGEPAYGLDTGPFNLVHIPDTSDPGSWEVLANVGTFYSGGDFWHGDFSKLYALDFFTNEFVTLDLGTGARTMIGVAHTPPGHYWTGLTAATDGTIYAVSSDCSVSSALFTIDRLTGEESLVGSTSAAPCLIDVAVNAQGEIYAVDISSDALFEIDPDTGAATAIGLLGFNANHAQSLDFEEQTGILYWAAADEYNGSLRRIDTTTGASLHVGYFPNYAGVDSFAFATGGGDPFWNDIPWVHTVPTSGVTLADGGFSVDVGFNTMELIAGECYTASLGLLHDDPDLDMPAMIPISLCATEPWPVYYLTKTNETGNMLPGGVVTYTIGFGNDGSLETGITISDVLPSEVDFGWSSPEGMVYDPASHTLVWDDLVLDHGAQMTATVAVTVHPDIPLQTWFTNTVYLLWQDEVLSDWASVQVGGQMQEKIYLPVIQKNSAVEHRNGKPSGLAVPKRDEWPDLPRPAGRGLRAAPKQGVRLLSRAPHALH